MRTITAGSTDNADGADVILKLLAARQGGGGIVVEAFAEGSSRALGLPRHVASTGKQAGNGDIFVDVLPVEAGAAELDAFALGRGRVQQARKPGQWHAQRAAIAQLDPHRVFVKSNCRRRNSHAMPSRLVPGVQ
jgi:hypothetical protein